MARKILSSYPDYGKAPAEYLLAVTEFVATLSVKEYLVLTEPRNGIAANCKFLPTVADMTELLAAEKARLEQFRPAHTAYRRFTAQQDPEQPPVERRKQAVQAELGYNPAVRRVEPPAFTPRPIAEIMAGPQLPPSPELKALLAELQNTNI